LATETVNINAVISPRPHTRHARRGLDKFPSAVVGCVVAKSDSHAAPTTGFHRQPM